VIDDKMRFTVRVPHYVVADLDEAAKVNNRTRNGQLVEIIEQWIMEERRLQAEHTAAEEAKAKEQSQ